MAEEQKAMANSELDEPLSYRLRKPPQDYNPPIQEQGEPRQKYMERLDVYNIVYWDQRNWEYSEL